MLTNEHIDVLSTTLETLLGRAEPGAMAYIRCLPPELVTALATAPAFAPSGWTVYRVADGSDASARTISADQAVELRESKTEPVLLLVDTERAGAGMDGIYSAAREIDEQSLFAEACRLAAKEVTKRCSRTARQQAEQALRLVRRRNYHVTVPPWAEFDYLVRLAAHQCFPGTLLHLLGLWPVAEQHGGQTDWGTSLDLSRLFVQRLLLRPTTGKLEAAIPGMRIAFRDGDQHAELESFLSTAASRSLFDAVAALANRPRLWIHTLPVVRHPLEIQQIDLVPWRNRTGHLTGWSGLRPDLDPVDPPLFVLPTNPETTDEVVKLEVRWKAQPPGLPRDSVSYHVSIVTDMDEELASKLVVHRGGQYESCKFFPEDFPSLDENASIPARVVVSVVDNESVEPAASEDFVILRGEPLEHRAARGATRVRTFSEGLMEAKARKAVTEFVSAISPQRPLEVNPKSYVECRVASLQKKFEVFRPPLLAAVEKGWSESNGPVGRWVARVRSSGVLAAEPEFLPVECPAAVSEQDWARLTSLSRKMAEHFRAFGGGVGQIYDQDASWFDSVVKDYLLAWARVLESGEPALALANTIEIGSLSGRTIGLIVLPSHPLRVAWHVAYDNLVFHVRFREEATPSTIRNEFAFLDGALFPAFLPGVEPGHTFVFADTLGFHTVAMVPDNHPEPKAAVALLAQALGGPQAQEVAPTVGDQTVTVLAGQIRKYIESHRLGQVLRVHALRPGDGRTVVRALGSVTRLPVSQQPTESAEETPFRDAAILLELYPSRGQQHAVGRFIAEVMEKRRRAAGVVAPEDRWMLDSIALPHGINLPRLRWAKKNEEFPKSSGHLALVFNLFRPRVVPGVEGDPLEAQPLYAYGLCAFSHRQYLGHPVPTWRTVVAPASDGPKHPATSTHTERLTRLQQLVLRCVTRHLGAESAVAELRCELGPEEQQILHRLHRQCDWVITLDRNAGIEYFDSPRDHPEVYETHIISCVPERGHLGPLQLMTSTANFVEVRERLERLLAQMGLPQSPRNTEFLLTALKALSGGLAIQLTGKEGIEPQSIALALGYARCSNTTGTGACWRSLDKGFFISLSEVADLLPPVREANLKCRGQAADLLYVSALPRRGLSLCFITAEYRRHRRAASAHFLSALGKRMESLRDSWLAWVRTKGTPPSFLALRFAKLAQILRFYADRAARHSLKEESYQRILAEIDRMIRNGPDYSMEGSLAQSVGWVFCPEFEGTEPELLPSEGNEVELFLFGPHGLPEAPFLAWEGGTAGLPGDAGFYQPEPERLDAPVDACADRENTGNSNSS